jgi:DNA-binding NtrC family response regulator
MSSILVVEDDDLLREAFEETLRSEGYDVAAAEDGLAAKRACARRTYDLVITDVCMPHMSGLELFRYLRRHSSETEVVVITAFGQLSDAVEVLKNGAADYLTKPVSPSDLLTSVRNILERRATTQRLRSSSMSGEEDDGILIGRSQPLAQLMDRITTVATSQATVLILGETGSGKELVARRLHAQSTRKGNSFIAIACSAFPETLIEAELFGYERGAFTGAAQRRQGRIKAADHGTLFLDEVAEMSLAMQAKLLRVLQEGSIDPIGTNNSVKVDVRVVSATNRDLRKRVRENLFREDLFYRLNVIELSVPPLRERVEDLPQLVEAFIGRAVARGGRPPARITPSAWERISRHSYPGNVRELQHAIERAVVLAAGQEVRVEHLPPDFWEKSADALISTDSQPLSTALHAFERSCVLRALSATHGRRLLAAKLLGISRKCLWEKMRAHDIGDEESPARISLARFS